MNFIDLDTVLTGLADRVLVPQESQFPEEARISEAAGLLRQTLHNVSQDRPRWVERNKISRKPEFNDAAIYPDAMAMLEHAAGWYRREVKNRLAHIALCLNAGLGPKDVEPSLNLADLPFPGVQFFRPREIGFDRAELVAFLDSNQIDHDLKPKVTMPSPTPGPQAAAVMAKGASDGGEPWKEKARERAYEIIKRDGAKDLYPSQVDLADEIAKEFRRDGVRSADGKPIAGAYIKRHALKGISSAQSKLLSTVMRRGK